MKKRFLCMLLALLLCAAIPAFGMRSAQAETTSGQCGDNLYWSFDASTGTLTVTGSGAMWEIDNLNEYWCDVREQIQSVVIGSGVTTIGDSAFEGCTELRTVSLPDSLIAIEPAAFFGCSNLASIAIPNGVSRIGYSAFLYCGALQTVTIPGSVTDLEHDAFCCCEGLKTVVLSKGVKNIGDSAFQTCSSLTAVTIPASVTSIGYCAFQGCPNLKDVYYGGTGAQKETLLNEHCDYYNDPLLNATWHYKPEVTTQPKAQTVAVGNSVTFSVAAAGAELTYQWQFSKDNGANWTNWSGKTKRSVTFNGSETNNGNLYRCVVKNSFGTAWSKPARITVSGVKPRIVEQPRAQTVAVGNSVTFRVISGGTGKTYQWQFSKNNGASWTNWSGKTQYNVAVTASATNNGCLYRCVIKNGSGSVTSEAARLTVSGVKPAILTQPKAQTVAVGNSVTFRAVAAGTGLTYQWQYSKDNGASWTNWSGKTKNSVTFNGSETNNGNFYRCVVKNSSGSVTSEAAKLTVSGVKPAILTQPKAQTVAVGNSVTFRAVAAGAGLTYQWQFSKDNGASWTNWSGKTKNSVTFNGSETNNGVLYRCVVKNDKGSVTSGAARLTVSGVKPAILTQPKAQTVNIGNSVTFSVVAAGTGLTYQWQYSKDNGASWTNWSGKTKNSVTFNGSETNNGNLYRCVVKNGSGSVTSEAVKLTVNQKKYRALLVGEVNFRWSNGTEAATRNGSDVEHMASMLKTVKGPSGAAYQVTKKKDLGRSALKSAIQSTFAGTTDQDVSLFFIATHGNSYDEGQLALTDGTNLSEELTFRELASWLSTYIKGDVIVILESCGSGSAIYANDQKAQDAFDPERHVQQAVEAFAALEQGGKANTGELRKNRFYVLAASRHQQESWGYEGGESGNFFTDWLIEGIGSSGAMPADTNTDSVVTLNELYQYIAQYDTYEIYYQQGGVWYVATQQVQVYPTNSGYQLFKR